MDARELVVYGWPRILLTKPSRAGLGCAAALAVYFFLGASTGTAESLASHYNEMWPAVLLDVLLGLIAAGFFPMKRFMQKQARRGRMRPWWQLRISPEGYGGRRGFGPVRWWDWGPGMEISCERLKGRVYRLRLVRISEIGSVYWSSRAEVLFRGTPARVARIQAFVDDCRAKAMTNTQQIL